MSVLVADDDLTICRILRTALRKENFDVEIVHNGIDALRVLQSPGAPPLALLDWSMPGLDGLEVCRRLHAAGGAAQRFVFLMSGRQDEEDLLRGFDAGVDAFIAKPFDPLRVNSRLRAAQRHLQAAGAHGAPSTAELLRQAARGSTGEVVIRSGERVGRVVFHEGKVT